MEDGKKSDRTVWEEVEVAGSQLVDRVKELAKEGSVRQVRIRSADGDAFLEAPLNLSIVVSGVVVLAAPWLAVLGVIAGLATRVKVEIERVEEPTAGETKVENSLE
ncbi:hypothetical protein U879_08405 [Defluviimonas sp. 20V17]|uniref:DUF4342 domain-containing protein n=1 Tax=Allgaiera indica TaxID=765699 RepID=A0AAN4UV97_9RHOB|nr:DUF4342 domain-containing protein [Allgaiera indica]KDB04128.1 hypothetical protein U879_08405 [Defluviimonas sp. 20V17]GHE06531.1 hypothetical protein GCM10008024_41120 [Allgaiera indica]SDX96557.1 protein of unknown function [Allgaiera indica]